MPCYEAPTPTLVTVMTTDLRSIPAFSPLDDATVGTVVDAMAPLVGMVVDLTWREAVIGHLRATAEAARLVADFPLDDELEPAPVFRA